MNLRQFARGKECQIRMVDHCNYNPETTVWAHYRLGAVAGMGQKPPDLCGAFACSGCHDAIDRRVKTDFTKVQVEAMMLYGIVRSLAIISKHYDITPKK